MDFLKKPAIAAKPRAAIQEYLHRNGVEELVVDVAYDVVDGKVTLDAARVTVPEVDDLGGDGDDDQQPNPLAGGSSHAPVFDFNATHDNLEAIAAISGEPELIHVQGSDLTSLLMPGAPGAGTGGGTKKKKSQHRRMAKARIGEKADEVAKALIAQGWACIDKFTSRDTIERVLGEISNLDVHYTPAEIWGGADASVGAQVHVPTVRGDKVLWMCGGHPRPAATGDFSRVVDQRGGVEPCDDGVKSKLRNGGARALNGNLVARFPGLRDILKAVDAFILGEVVKRVPKLNDCTSRSDCMLATYPGNGSRFQAHVDNTTKDGRKLTILVYLNLDWNADDDGGALRLHPDIATTKDPPRDVIPRAGRIVAFFSDEMKHEVRPTFQHRKSLTMWYYDNNERKAAIDRAHTDDAAAVASAIDASDDERRRAQVFALSLCSPDSGPPTEATVSRLAQESASLPLASQKILAGMAGVPELYFTVALQRMQPADLLQLRHRFGKMGV